jgi:hypothetical protein
MPDLIRYPALVWILAFQTVSQFAKTVIPDELIKNGRDRESI